MTPEQATEITTLAQLAALRWLARGTVLIVGAVAAAAVAVFLIAISIALGGRFPYRAVLFVLGERSSRRSEEAPALDDPRSSSALVPSLAGGGD